MCTCTHSIQEITNSSEPAAGSVNIDSKVNFELKTTAVHKRIVEIGETDEHT